MAFVTFEDIDAWQEARKLSRQIRMYARRAIAKHDWSWADQISRSVLSTMANIAEGNDAQTNAEFIAFLGYAKRSMAETRSHLYYGLDNGYMEDKEFEDSKVLATKICAQLAKLIKYLEQHRSVRRMPGPSKVKWVQATSNNQQ